MKKYLLVLVISLICFFTFDSHKQLAAEPEAAKMISVQIDGLPVNFDVRPLVQNNRTLVPFRALAEALNVSVTWDNATQTVFAQSNKTDIKLKIADKTAYIDNKPITLDAPPIIINGRILVPLRFFSESFNCLVGWDNASSTIKIDSPPIKMAVTGFYALGDTETSSWRNLFGKSYPETDTANTDIVTNLALGWYSMDEQGNLLTKSTTGWQRPDGWQMVLEAGEEYNLNSQMLLHLTDGDLTLSKLLNDQSSINRAINQIAQEAKLYKGVNLDFEGLGWLNKDNNLTQEKNNFTKFVGLLANKLRQENIKLILTLHAPNSAYKGYDYKALGELADEIIIMAYDYGPKPEPLNMVVQAVEMAKVNVPSEKLVLGISLPSETPESIIAKIGVAKRYNLNGIALWRLGLVSDSMWRVLRQNIAH